jgi:hypothetical protein
MRTGPLFFSLGLFAAALGCGDRSYRLGGSAEPELDSSRGSSGGVGTGPSVERREFSVVDVDDSALSPPLVREGIERITSEQSSGTAFVVADEDHVYFNTWAGAIWRAQHDGSSRVRLADNVVYHMVADETHVYCSSNAEIMRVPKSGGAPETVSVLGASPSLRVLALALTDEFVYATTEGGADVVRAPKTGGPYQLIATSSSSALGGVAVNDQTVYWADTSRPEGTVLRHDLVTDATTMFFQTGGAMLLPIESDLWFTHPLSSATMPLALSRIPFGSGKATLYRANTHAIHFASDETHVYWFRNERLGRINRANRSDEPVAELPGEPMGVAVSKQWLFVADGAPSGGIFRLPKPPP